MKVLFAILLIFVAVYQCYTQEVINLSKPSASEIGGPVRNIIDTVIEKLRQKIPEEIHFPDKDYKGGPKYICMSTGFKLFDSLARGLKEFYYNIKYGGPQDMPMSYNFKFTVEAVTNYKLSCSPWIKYHGPINVSVANLEFNGDLKSSLIPPKLRFTSMAAHVDVIYFDLKGIMNKEVSSMVSMILTDRVTDMINDNQQAISNQLMTYLNDMLEHFLPGSAQLEENENVDVTKYTEEELLEELQILYAALDQVINKVESVFNDFSILS